MPGDGLSFPVRVGGQKDLSLFPAAFLSDLIRSSLPLIAS
jgi:hypothetical protein